MKLYLGVAGVFVASSALFALGACTDDTGTSTTGNTSSSSTSTGSSGDTSSSSSSGITSSSSSSGVTSSSSSSGTSSSGKTCSECTNDVNGAYANECKAEWDKCKVDTACAALAKCSYDMCATNADGGSCTQKCATDLNTPMASKALFCAVDNCVFCKTCTALCESAPVSAAGYCAVTKAGVCLGLP